MKNLARDGRTQETASSILRAAREVFAEKGFGGARVDEIARRAGVNKATIYYHIGDKRSLYEAAIHNVVSRTRQLMQEGTEHEGSPKDKLAVIIRTFAKVVDENPHVGPLMLREIASGGKHLPAAVLSDIAGIIGLLTGITEEGRKLGQFSEINPFLLYIMIVGMIILFKTSAPLRKRSVETLGAVVDTNDAVAGPVADSIERLVLNAVRLN